MYMMSYRVFNKLFPFTNVDENKSLNAQSLGLRRVLFLIFKIHLYQIIWLSAILAFRFAFSRLHSSGLLHVTGSLANARLRPTKNLASFHNFYKIVPLRSVFALWSFLRKLLRRLLTTSLYTRKLGRFLV